MNWINAKSTDMVRIEILGESRSESATGASWVNCRNQAAKLAMEVEQLREAMLSLRSLWPLEKWATLSYICRDHPVIEEEFCRNGTKPVVEAGGYEP